MKSSKLGKNISKVEVLNISSHGIWLLVKNHEYFLNFKDYPWFQGAKISQICHVELLHDQHLHWSELDVDLELASLIHPEKYPLGYK